MGIDMQLTDVSFRCNLVTLSEGATFGDMTMLDYSSDEISTAEAAELIAYLAKELPLGEMSLYSGISYRHCLVIPNAQTGSACTPPHDILNRRVGDYLPHGVYGDALLTLMRRSRELLPNHPVNKARVARGLRPANCCWFWGEGTRPALKPFEEVYGLKAGVISAVDLIKGIGRRGRCDWQHRHQL